MLEVAPENRVTAREALKHPWLEIKEEDYCVAGKLYGYCRFDRFVSPDVVSSAG